MADRGSAESEVEDGDALRTETLVVAPSESREPTHVLMRASTRARAGAESERRRGGDPMASIRPALPSGPPAHAPTVELGQLATGTPEHADNSGMQPTLEPHLELEGDTHESGPFVIPVLEADERQRDPNHPDEAVYALVERIGEGGMGEVWLARQRSLGRRVALKRLRKGAEAPSAIIRQFESEARLTGVLDHPNIVTVHELGRDQRGRVFYTMKLIEGTPWSRLLASGTRTTSEGKQEKLELRDHLEILLEVANAIAFAHSRGIIHRDIKPGNVMVGDYGEVLVVDWGLAVAVRPIALLGGAETWTLANLPRHALVCGTPAYMAPETALAERDRICPATDVYLLGAVLYHVLYERPPHRGKTVDEVIAAAKRNEWAPPKGISRRLRPWHVLLRPLLRRALVSDPALRFADAGEFAEALREALRNYDSAKLASGAQEQLSQLDLARMSPAAGYQAIDKIIARLEEALHDWAGNVAARRGLAQAHLSAAEFALRHNDLGVVDVHLAAFDALPKLEPPIQLRSREESRQLGEETLVGAPRPSDSLVVSAVGEDKSGAGPGTPEVEVRSREDKSGEVDSRPISSRASTVAPPLLLGASASSLPRGTQAMIGPIHPGLPSPLHSGSASVSIEQLEDAELREADFELEAQALNLRAEALERGQAELRRRRAYKTLRLFALALALGLLAIGISTAWLITSERNRATQERSSLARIVLLETAASTESQLVGRFAPVRGALFTALGWARLGLLDTDDPSALNQHFMPLLEGVDVATSTLRADSSGREYMLLRTDQGWRTRTTFPRQVPELRDWDLAGNLVDTQLGQSNYDPLSRPWYTKGAALRAEAERAAEQGLGPPPVHWTDPYGFFTTKELGISVSAPATSPSGRQFVIAFDVKLADISEFTMQMPREIEQGQVFVLDADDQVLGLPREAGEQVDRATLELHPIAELAEALPRSHDAWQSWVARGRTIEPFRTDDGYWVGFRPLAGDGLPRLWIGVVLPESHFLPGK